MVPDETTQAIIAACEDLSDRYLDRLWTERRAEIDVGIEHRREIRRRSVVQGIAVTGYSVGDPPEFPTYFEPVRERRWFGRRWRLVQDLDAAVASHEDRLRHWLEQADAQ